MKALTLAKRHIAAVIKSTHLKDSNFDNYNVTVNHLFTSEARELNKQLGL